MDTFFIGRNNNLHLRGKSFGTGVLSWNTKKTKLSQSNQMLVFEERGKSDYLEKNLSEQNRDSRTQPTYEVVFEQTVCLNLSAHRTVSVQAQIHRLHAGTIRG